MQVTTNDILNIAQAIKELGSVKTPDGYGVNRKYIENLLTTLDRTVTCYEKQLMNEKDEEN